MTPEQYSDSKFGSIVYFDVVEQDRAGFAKVFSQGSSALEALLLSVWSKGIQTFACGNDHIMIFSEKDTLSYEREVQSKYNSYVQARGLNKVLKKLHKRDFIACHNAYISFDPSTFPVVEAFGRRVMKAMKLFSKECRFHIGRPKLKAVGNKKTFGLYFSISREKEFENRDFSLMSDDEILRTAKPPSDLFDPYFHLINQMAEEHFEQYRGKDNNVAAIQNISLTDTCPDCSFSDHQKSNHENDERSSLVRLIADAEVKSQQNLPARSWVSNQEIDSGR